MNNPDWNPSLKLGIKNKRMKTLTDANKYSDHPDIASKI
jgi:hypothetical protein